MDVVCTNQSYSLCYVFLRHASEDDYIWALRRMRIVSQDRIAGPIFIVIDRELALMATISRVHLKLRIFFAYGILIRMSWQTLKSTLQMTKTGTNFSKCGTDCTPHPLNRSSKRIGCSSKMLTMRLAMRIYIPHGFCRRRNSSLLGPKKISILGM